jgi:hypothetical protein
MSTTAHGVLRSRDVPSGVDIRSEAHERLLRREEEAILQERAAELEAKRPELLASVQEAAEACSYNGELKQAQEAVADAWQRLNDAVRALKSVRSDDAAARLKYKRVRNAALREGLTESELAAPEPELSRMRDIAPGVGEQSWPSTWGRG